MSSTSWFTNYGAQRAAGGNCDWERHIFAMQSLSPGIWPQRNTPFYTDPSKAREPTSSYLIWVTLASYWQKSSSSSSSVSLENVFVCVQFQLDTPIGYLAQSSTWIWASWLFCHQGRKLLAGKLKIIMSHPPEGSPSQPAPSTTSPDAPSATLVSFHLGSNLKEKKCNLQIYLWRK